MALRLTSRYWRPLERDTLQLLALQATILSVSSAISLYNAFGSATLYPKPTKHSEKAIPGYGGGMSSAKAALESDTRTLAQEVGKLGIRVKRDLCWALPQSCSQSDRLY